MINKNQVLEKAFTAQSAKHDNSDTKSSLEDRVFMTRYLNNNSNNIST